MRRVPCDLYPDAWRRPLFARRLGRKGSPGVGSLSLSQTLKKRSLKYGGSVVNRRSLRNHARYFDEKKKEGFNYIGQNKSSSLAIILQSIISQVVSTRRVVRGINTFET